MIGLGHALSLALAPQGAGGAPPSEPQNFRVTARTNTSLAVSWDAVPEGVEVDIQWQVLGGDWSVLLGEFGVFAPPPAEVTGLAANTAYDIRCRSVLDGARQSEFVTLSGECTRPAVPTGLAAVTGAYGKVNLSWDALAAGVTVSVYVGGNVSGSVGLTGTSYAYDAGSPALQQDYSLLAVADVSGLASAASDAVTATTGVGSAPVNTSAPHINDQGSQVLLLDWNGVWSADPSSLIFTYDWQYYMSGWASVNNTNDTITGGPGNSYRCIVTATNAVGSGQAISNQIDL